MKILRVDSNERERERERGTLRVLLIWSIKRKKFALVNRIFLFYTDKNSLDERLPGNRYLQRVENGATI